MSENDREAEDTATREKACTKCGLVRPLTDYYRRKVSGYVASECKGCASHRSTDWAKKNRARRREISQAWVHRNPEKRAASYLASYVKNKSRALASQARWSEENKPRHRALIKKWRAANKELVRESWLRRYARVRGATTAKIPGWWMAVLRADPCSYCGRTGGQIDHAHAIGGGGAHSVENVVSCCPRCNMSKQDTPLLPWLLRRAI